MELLEKFNMADALPAKYPMDKNFSLTSPAVPVPQKMFIVLFGALMFIGRVARPDILPALKRLGRFTANHDATHWEALKHILRYLKSNPDMPLTVNKGMGGALGKARLTAMADSSHADCAMTRRSTSGHLIFFNGTPVAFNSRRQSVVALSTTEAEIIALSECLKDVLYLYQLLDQMHPVELPIIIYEDNKACRDTLSNPAAHGVTKYIDLRYMHAREYIKKGIIKIQAVSTDDNVADFFTKPLVGEKFERFRSVIMGHTQAYFPTV
jgi:hypothetical protein